jgi:hypothetical protein
VGPDVAAGVRDVTRLGHDIEVLLAVEHHPQPAADHAAGIGDHDLDHARQS